MSNHDQFVEVEMPQDMAQQIEHWAKALNTTPEDLIREAWERFKAPTADEDPA